MNKKSPNSRRRFGAVTLLYAALLPTAFAASTTISVNFGSNLSTMPAQGLGVCTAVYDNSLISSAVSSALVNAGVKAVRYPGGSYADAFNWQTTTMNGGAYLDSNDSFDNFMNTVVNPTGAKAIITVNYGSNPSNNGGGDPNVAAAWVKYANITKGWGITYWEIGNEVGGNGYYAYQDWEYDLHFLDQTAADRVGQSVLSPTAYGQNAVTFINAMKAQDSSIKCGVGFDTVYQPYNDSLLTACASVVDFVVIHWYPGGSESALLQTPSQIPGLVSSAHSQISSYVGSRAGSVGIMVTETGAGTVTGQATALFAADDYLSWFENGIWNVDYQELHNGFLDANNNLLGPAYGAKMAGILAAPGETFVTTSSGSSLIATHATKKANGHYDVMLINKDPNNSYTVTVNVSGATLASSGTRYDCSNTSGVSQSTLSGIGASSFSITVPAYTITVVDIAPGSGGGGGGGTIANGTYKIINRNSSLALEVVSAATTNTAPIDQRIYAAGSNQKWTVTSLGGGQYEIVGVGSGKSLDVYGDGTANGTKIDIYPYSGNANQKWSFTATSGGYYRITPANATGSCLDVTGASTSNGTLVELWNSNGGNNQQWILQSP
jgi:hypothetical protein